MKTKTVFLAAPAAVVASLAAVAPSVAAPLPPLDAARVQAISEMLPREPTAVGKPISDRAYWGRLASDKRLASVVPTAEKLQKTPLPEWGGDMFLDFSRNGNRTRYQTNENLRRGRLAIYALAECMENKGRFVAPLAALIDSLCQEKTWVLPAHDTKLDNYNGKTIDIDLVSSALAAQLGTIDAILGDKLPAQTRQNLRTNVQTRVLQPFHDMITGKREPNWWILTQNNWNAVCLNGVVGAALALEPSRTERALVVAATEKYSENFLSGFTPDGYCSEGLGYWNYGFGNYDLLCEAIRQTTGGKLDLMARPKAKMPALFGARIQIMNDIAPAFADCPVFAKPSVPLMASINRRFALQLPGYETLNVMPAADIYETLVYVAGETAPPIKTNANQAATPFMRSPLRDFFDTAGILISRPAPNGTTKLGVALKGGNNAENHNHNDIGSYVVVVGDRPVLLDPGSETYTARTFSSKRYDSKLLNSFGHPVPKFGDVLQHAGADAKGKILKTETTPDTDTFSLDITSAYRLPALKSLTRTWNYNRKGDGSLTVTDNVSLSSPTPFGTALLTLGGYRKNPDGTLFVYDGASAVNVKIETNKPYTVSSQVIVENAAVKPTRIGIDLSDPVSDATVTLTITPVVDTAALGTDANLLINGSLERGGFGWSLGTMGTVSESRTKTGTTSLRILDDASDGGSSVESVRAAIPAGATRAALKGVANFASGGGVGLYLHFYDKDNKSLAVLDAAGNEAATGVLEGGPSALNQWKPFSFSASIPPGAVKAQLWIHTFNASKSDVYLDDLSLTVEK